jgi:anthranilate phosphoribosyltransferase
VSDAGVLLRAALGVLADGRSLPEEEGYDVLVALTAADVPPALAGALLAALRTKGVNADELRGFARGMRALARSPALPEVGPLVDIVGTGGDASHSYNISTGTALLAVAAGAKVAKHGNRSVSSRSGSADVLESLGLNLPLDERDAGACLAATGFTFLFAPHYHPAMKAIAPVRAALGIRTVFNMLGPLTNPAAPPYYLIGAYSPDAMHLIADTLAGLPISRAFVVHGADGWDEPTPVGPFELCDVRDGRWTRHVRSAADYGLASCTAEDLRGGDASDNARALRAVFEGADQGAHRDALLMGTSLALEVMGVARDARDGVERAARAIDSGAAAALLEGLAAFSRSRS